MTPETAEAVTRIMGWLAAGYVSGLGFVVVLVLLGKERG